MKIFFTIIILIAQFIVHDTFAQSCGERYHQKIFQKTKVTRNIFYGENYLSNGQLKKMHFDVYEPEGDTSRNRMVLVMMHGGAYWSGDKNHGQCRFLGQDLSKMGYVVISPQYRYEPSFLSLLDQEKMVKAVARGTQDAKAIIRYLFKDVMENGNTWGIDTSIIIIGGASAGAFNALHATYLDSEDILNEDWTRWIEEAGGTDGTTSAVGYPYKVAGVVNISGALAKASILDNEHLPFLSIHDIGDTQVPFNSGQPYSIQTLPEVDGSNILHAKAIEIGIENPFYIIPGNGHTSYEELGMRIQPMYDSTVFYIKEFMSNIYCRKYMTTHISTAPNLTELKIYPNPSNGIFILKVPTELHQYQQSKVVIYDHLGTIVHWENLEINNQSLNLNFLPNGSYQIILYQKDTPWAKGILQLIK